MNNNLLVVFCLCFLVNGCQNENKEKDKETNLKKEFKTKAQKPKEVYGFNIQDFDVIQDTISKGDIFGSIMDKHGVNPTQVYNITQSIPDSVFNFKMIKIGKPYTIVKEKDSLKKPRVFVYEHNKIEYTKVFLGDSIYAENIQKPVTVKTKVASGVINSSLSVAVDEAGLDYSLTNQLADIYQWTIDFFRIQPGDRFKVVYKEKYINDTIYAGLESIDAAVIEHQQKPFYAFEYTIDTVNNKTEFFDEKAKTLRSFFLKAPVQYSRISSRYSPRRFHPVQKRWKAHKGTDYAAPRGTSICSTANGVVIKSGYTRGNGNYVKVKHSDKYTTQYLHMSKRAVKVGQRVSQGEVIGYVGSTGLATGPHVCYRFWVYGKQVDPFKQNLPSAEPLPYNQKSEYFEFIKDLKSQLDQDFIEKEIAESLSLEEESPSSI